MNVMENDSGTDYLNPKYIYRIGNSVMKEDMLLTDMQIKNELTGYPSIDKPWLKYYSKEAIQAPLPECTVWENIYEHNKGYLSDVALIYFGKKISYGTMFHEIDKTAKAFAYLNVKSGDNVAICMPAMPEAIYAILALNKLGANAAMVNPTFSKELLEERVNEMEPNVLVVVSELYVTMQEVIQKSSVKHVVVCPAANSLGIITRLAQRTKSVSKTTRWNKFIRQGQKTSYEAVRYEKQFPAIMVFSSGTTGASKGIQLTNDGINATGCEYEYGGFGFQRQDLFLAQVPIWFSTGISVTILVPLIHGVTVILEPIYDFKLFYRHIMKYRPNFLVTATGLLDYLMNKKPESEAYRHFKYLVAGGEYVTPSAEKKYNKWLADNQNQQKLHKGYGMCECGGTVTSTNKMSNTVGATGIPLPHVTVAAFDVVTGHEKKYGERGEIRVLTPCRMLGYYKKSKETAEYFHMDENGKVWACTGDMGYVTDDGNVYISGRISDSYTNLNGETVYLFDIERAVLDIPEVRQCKAVMQEIQGKSIHVCHIVFDNNVDWKNVLCMIKEHCRHKLDKAHQPMVIRIYSDALPVASSGKLDIEKMKKNTDNLIYL